MIRFGYEVGQKVWAKVKIKEIRITPTGIRYEVTPIAEFNLVSISIREEDIVAEKPNES